MRSTSEGIEVPDIDRPATGAHDDLFVGVGKGECGEGRGVVGEEGVEDCDGFGGDQVVEYQIVVFVADCEVVLEAFREPSAEDALAHGLVIIWLETAVRRR
jgi:hypothetical protein